ncbi:MAG: helix-turn-helix domain-containing protein [Actinobacteria bacterium]|nr:helix-turn-helix domain-containing protein [Actinomycetota bacterium]
MTRSGATRLGPTRTDVLHHLRVVGEPVPVAEVAEALGLHANTTRFHLDALTEAGLVVREAEERSRPGRPKILYSAAHGHRSHSYRDLAGAMVRHLSEAMEDWSERAVATGVSWGEGLRAERGALAADEDPLDGLVDSLDELGYAPELVPGSRFANDGETIVELRSCPYRELADADPEGVCKVHLGLVRGLLGDDADWNVLAIEPFVAPGTCVVRLESVTRAGTADA